jgi:hypothetical protein
MFELQINPENRVAQNASLEKILRKRIKYGITTVIECRTPINNHPIRKMQTLPAEMSVGSAIVRCQNYGIIHAYDIVTVYVGI